MLFDAAFLSMLREDVSDCLLNSLFRMVFPFNKVARRVFSKNEKPVVFLLNQNRLGLMRFFSNTLTFKLIWLRAACRAGSRPFLKKKSAQTASQTVSDEFSLNSHKVYVIFCEESLSNPRRLMSFLSVEGTALCPGRDHSLSTPWLMMSILSVEGTALCPGRDDSLSAEETAPC